ncbi:alpha/beta fold hydrolase [Streptomyces sp. NPDC059894]|uniref:alpha/beta fold hydrolase n=1 Tax=unclassified Streptomyces TaxID=2593676 RepID=UPI003646EB08
MQTFSRDGAAIAYRDTGTPSEAPEAPTVVFGHGLLFGGWMFDPQVTALSRRYRCVTIDWRGQGGTPRAESGYDMDSLTEDVIALLAELGTGPVHYVGLSMGGFVGMRLAARRPDLVRSLSLLSTSSERDSPDVDIESAKMAGMLWAFGTAPAREALARMAFGRSFRGRAENAALIQDWFDRIDRADRHGIACAMMGVIARTPVTEELAHVTAPTLVVHGDDDQMPISCGQAVASAIKDARFHALCGSGHACTLDQPAEVTRVLAEFLAEN